MAVFTMLFLCHVLGDYYFQPQCLAERKSRSVLCVLIHAAIYAGTAFLSLLLLGGGYIWAVVISSSTHCLIDVVKQLILNSRARRGALTIKEERAAFVIDQILHLCVISAASVWATQCFEIVEPPFMAVIWDAVGVNAYALISYIAIALVLIKPANVFVKKMLFPEKPQETIGAASIRAGAYIGALERLLAAALLALGQYAAIALVFTAKSIARFRALENREFAEYYLFGTLLSVVTTVGVFGIVKLLGVL